MSDATACQAIDEELSAMMSQLESLVGHVRASQVLTQRMLLEPHASSHLRQCKRKVAEMKIEADRVENSTIRDVYANKATALETAIKTYAEELKRLITPEKKAPRVVSDRERIMGDAGGAGDMLTVAPQALTAASRAQDDNLEILRRTRAILVAVEDVGNAIVVKLQEQDESMHMIQKDLSSLQGQINRAKGDVMWFSRQMSGDKCFLCLTMLVIVALFVLVGWKVYDRRVWGGDGTWSAMAVPATSSSLSLNTPPPLPVSGAKSTNGTTTIPATMATSSSMVSVPIFSSSVTTAGSSTKTTDFITSTSPSAMTAGMATLTDSTLVPRTN